MFENCNLIFVISIGFQFFSAFHWFSIWFDFESHPRFSKKYLLKGDNETSVRQLFNDNLIKYIESKEKISLEGGGNQLVFYRPGKRVKPEDIENFMDEGFHFLKMFLKAT